MINAHHCACSHNGDKDYKIIAFQVFNALNVNYFRATNHILQVKHVTLYIYENQIII